MSRAGIINHCANLGEIENQLLYIVEDGCFQLFRADAPAAKYSSGVFGEVEFLSGVPRQNTAISQPTKKGTNTSSSAYALRRDGKFGFL
jgi:hypothetical protein